MEKDILYRFFEGTATAEETAAIRQWMDESAEHRKEFLEQRKLFDAMVLLPGVEESACMTDDGTDSGAGDMEVETVEESSHFSLMPLWRYAAVVVLTVGVTLGLLHHFRKGSEAVMLTASVPAGQRAEITLPDSTTVWLNSGSVLKYPSIFSGDRRDILLDGEGYFTVTKDKHKPFTVQTSNGYVTVLGTVFNLKSYSAEPRMEASLVSGQVKAKGKTGEEVVLKPSQKMVWDNGRTSVVNTNDDDYLWRTGILTFTDQPLSVVLFRLGKTYNKNVTIRKKSLRNIILSGKFRVSDGMDYALRILKDTYGFRYTTNPDTGDTVIY